MMMKTHSRFMLISLLIGSALFIHWNREPGVHSQIPARNQINRVNRARRAVQPAGKPNVLFIAADEYASWGLLDIGEGNYRDGYQSVPVNWGASSERKRQFFELLKRLTGGAA